MGFRSNFCGTVWTTGIGTAGRLAVASCFAVAVLSACESEVELPPLWIEPDQAAVASFGDRNDGNVFGRVRDAAISPTGRYVAVLDRDGPAVHVFDRTAGEGHVFGRVGGGPGEMMNPMSLSFSGDSILAVLRSGGIDLFSPEGGYINRIRSSDLGFAPQAITNGCGQAFFLYGLKRDESRVPDYPWLHRIDSLTEDATLTSVLSLPESAQRWGALEGLDGSETAVVLWHRTGQVQVGWVISCAEGTAHLLDERLDPIQVEQALTDDGLRGSVLTLPDTLFNGAVVTGRTFIVGHSVRADREDFDSGITLFRSWSEDGTGCVTAQGNWRVYDAEADVIALSASDPYPRVVLVPSSALKGLNAVGRPCG